ncbi:hypothetical protein [Oligoflexus tunisiensis]|uniref:hypothetical protein n=1 Tax=Oligoflexus tunisiensis TaxID=708132 RepID=UPI00114C8AE1|nr:hypothetical protein [Oligoflexus tunisiensis]
MQIKTHYVLGLALAFSLVACGKDEKTKTVTVENPKTVEALKAAETERDKLKAELELVGNTEDVKAELEKANARVAELDKSISDKETEIEAAKKELEEARKNGDAKASELEVKVKDLEGQKGELSKELETAKSDKTRLAAQVETAQRDEELFKTLLDYAVAQDAKDRATIGEALDKDIQAIEKTLEGLAGKEADLKANITTQAEVVVKAAENLAHVSENMKGVYDALSARAEKGETLSAADKSTLETLKAYYDAAAAEAAEKKTKETLEKAIGGLNQDIATLSASLAAAESDLAKYQEELLALVLTDSKLETPRAKELTSLIADRKGKIAQAISDKAAKTSALAEQDKLLTEAKGKIEALVKTQNEKLTAYQDSNVSAARDALTNAEKELDGRVAAYHQFQKDTADAQSKKAALTVLKEFYNAKLKPAQD